MNLYIAVTADPYEFPVFLADSPRELAARYSMTSRCLNSYIYRGTTRKKEGVKFVKVHVEETES